MTDLVPPERTRGRDLSVAAAALAILACSAVLLRMQGRIWWCADGRLTPWTADAFGPHNSQHLLDPYSFTHLLHGLVLWAALSPLAGRIAAPWRVLAGLGLEAAWEVLENAPWVIERYRAGTAAVGYSGDSVMNSLGDIVVCGIGLVLAPRLGWRLSLALFVVTEAILLVWIRDGLVLNVLMLAYPIDAIRQWQMGH